MKIVEILEIRFVTLLNVTNTIVSNFKRRGNYSNFEVF